MRIVIVQYNLFSNSGSHIPPTSVLGLIFEEKIPWFIALLGIICINIPKIVSIDAWVLLLRLKK